MNTLLLFSSTISWHCVHIILRFEPTDNIQLFFLSKSHRHSHPCEAVFGLRGKWRKGKEKESESDFPILVKRKICEKIKEKENEKKYIIFFFLFPSLLQTSEKIKKKESSEKNEKKERENTFSLSPLSRSLSVMSPISLS